MCFIRELDVLRYDWISPCRSLGTKAWTIEMAVSAQEVLGGPEKYQVTKMAGIVYGMPWVVSN